MVKISELQAPAQTDVFSQHQRPTTNPIETEITPEPVLLPYQSSQGWAGLNIWNKLLSFAAC